MALSLPFPFSMERKIYHQAVFMRQLITTGLLLGLTLCFESRVSLVRAGQGQAKAVEPAVAAFNERVKQYIKLRDKLEGELPKLAAKSQPPGDRSAPGVTTDKHHCRQGGR
jgi:hypothetical protein